ncbi:MAG: YjzC family protein [Patescibacteria group bacterium]
MKHTYKPGETTPRSGQYEKIGPRGGETGEEITAVKGKTFPPSEKFGFRSLFGAIKYEVNF